MKTNRRAFLMAAVAAATCSTPIAWAQAYPARPMTLVVAYPAGGDTDVLARLFAEKLSHRLGQPVVVENRTGASGVIGSSFVAKAAPDGYTLLLAPSTFSIAQLVLKTGREAGYDVLHGFTPVIQAGTVSLFLVAGANAGFRNFQDVLAAARSRQVSYATPGSGSPMHILGEMVKRATGARFDHVPYKGVMPAVSDVLGGHVPLSYVTLGTVAPYIQSGKLVPMAVADSRRSALAPAVPTLKELGYKDVEVTSWYGLFGPKGMPPEVVRTLNAHLNEILRMPDVVVRMASLGAVPVGGSPETLAQANAEDHERFARIIRNLAIQAD
ncbi:MAG TPA: tripartite tricarboxylate transporter substrate binding protein [Ramlibacter sp.]|nr:tripartite tricarboxylate transporter substrate binding protein [Ramlibacter sp.]